MMRADRPSIQTLDIYFWSTWLESTREESGDTPLRDEKGSGSSICTRECSYTDCQRDSHFCSVPCSIFGMAPGVWRYDICLDVL